MMLDYTSEQLTIDMDTPKITLEYSNNDIKGTFADKDTGLDRGYFNADRTLTITIDEHSFRADEIVASVIAKDCFSPDAKVVDEAFKVKNVVTGEYDVIDALNYGMFLSNRNFWKSVGDTRTAEIVYNVDANFTFALSYTDILGFANDGIALASGTEAPYIFTVDKLNPSGLKIEYTSNPIYEWLNAATFGLFFRNTVTVTVSAVDETAGLEKIEYWYTKLDGSSELNQGGGDVFETVSDELTLNEYNHTASFAIDPQPLAQFKGWITIKATDKAARWTELVGNDETGITVDNIAPVLDVKYTVIKQIVDLDSLETHDESAATDLIDAIPDNSIVYFDNTITATVKINDANFYPEDMTKVITETGTNTDWNERKTGTASRNDNGIWVTDITNPATPLTAERKIITDWTQDGDVWTGTTTIENEGDYILNIKYTDRSGNKMLDYTSEQLTVDRTDPTVKVEYNATNVYNEKYFNEVRTATFTIKEHNFRKSTATYDNRVDVDFITAFNATNAAGVSVPIEDFATYLNTRSSWTKVATDTYEAKITFVVEANYIFTFKSYTDLAKRVDTTMESSSPAPFEFTYDKTKPTGSIKVGDWTQSVDGTAWDHLLDTISFGLWSNIAKDVEIKAADELSGVEKIEHFRSTTKYTEEKDFDSVASGVWITEENDPHPPWDLEHSTRYTVNPDETFIVYTRVTDAAHNIYYISSDGIIVDKTKPIIDTTKPVIEITVPEITGDIYKGDVRIDYTITDPVDAGNGSYSGLRSYTYEVFNLDATSQIPVTVNYEGPYATPADLKQKTDPGSHLIVDSSKNNSNNVKVVFNAVDNAGNPADEVVVELKIDITKPKIEITYDNNLPDTVFGDHFKENRTAKIVVTERNFDEKDFKYLLTNDHGTTNAITNFNTVPAGLNGDDTTHTATILFDADGDYKFKKENISYTDQAGNMSEGVDYKDSVAPEEFTIDKTLPLINVSFDNNDFRNVNGYDYYKAKRIATVTITEHNFETGRIVITMTTLDRSETKKAIAIPAVNGWSNSGDNHSASILFEADAEYTFDIEYTDMAGNKAAEFDEIKFVVDKTKPVVRIAKNGAGEDSVVNEMAYNDIIEPIFEYFDDNIEECRTDGITFTGSFNGDRGWEIYGKYSNIANGKQFVFNDFPREKDFDDLYTLKGTITDPAGNVSDPMSVTFSVNRFGSVFTFDDATRILNGKAQRDEQDVVIIETNVDILTESKLAVTAGGKTTELTGDNYKVENTSVKGGWSQYRYTIDKSNFAEDNRYKVTVTSVDKATNYSDTIQAERWEKPVTEGQEPDKELNFTIDKTPPVCTLVNVQADKSYKADIYPMIISASDNIALSNIQIELYYKGELNRVVGVPKVITSAEIAEIIKNGEELTFDLPRNQERDTLGRPKEYVIKVVVLDEALNAAKVVDASGSEYDMINGTYISGIVISPSIWDRFLSNDLLLFGSIGLIVLAAGGSTAWILLKRKRKA